MQQPELQELLFLAKSVIAEHEVDSPKRPRRRSPIRGVPGLLKLMDVKKKHGQKNQTSIVDSGSQGSRAATSAKE